MWEIDVIEQVANRLLQHNVAEARIAIETEYPFHKVTAQERNYADKEKMAQFVRDGFIDRYYVCDITINGLFLHRYDYIIN